MSDDPDYNPMSQDSIGNILKKRAQLEKQKALHEEEVEEYKKTINRLFSSPDGQYFLKKLIRYCGVHSFDNALNPAKLVEDNGKRKVFLELIRPYLDKTILMELEQ